MQRLAVLGLLVVAVGIVALADMYLGVAAGSAMGALVFGGAAWYARGRWECRQQDKRRVRERAYRAAREAFASSIRVR